MPNFILSLALLFGLTACSGGMASNPIPTVLHSPRSPAPLTMGVYLSSWNESAITRASLGDLLPGVVRINYPAFPLLTRNVDAQEAKRLVGLIESDIAYARALGALPLIVTTLGTVAPATSTDVYATRQSVADYYAGVAKRFPGMAWEIGNEAEISSGGGDAPLLVTTYAAVFETHARAIRLADPTAKLVTAGTSGFADIWIRAVLALTHPDAVGVHPYGTAPQNYATAVAQIGTKLPVWFTEFGLQNAMPQQVTDYFTYSHGVVPVAVWFCLSDLSAERGSTVGSHQTFGLMDAQGNRRPTYGAAKAAFAK